MKKVTLDIENFNQSLSVTLDEELSFGRTDLAKVVLDDEGLSRVNTTIFRDGDEILIVDENSTNGTFLNGKQISGPPTQLFDGDEIKIGNNTRIQVKVGAEKSATKPISAPSEISASSAKASPKTAKKNKNIPSAKPQQNQYFQLIVVSSAVFTFVVIGIAGIALWVTSGNNEVKKDNKNSSQQSTASGFTIPIRVIDPLGNEDQDDINDILASWEGGDKGAAIEDLGEVKATTSSGTVESTELNVTTAFWKEQQNIALQARSSPTGIRPPGLNVPPALYGDGVIKQKRKLEEMKNAGYQQPADFADLAKKRMAGELIELPLAKKSFVLEVGSSATKDEFTELIWNGDSPRSVRLDPMSPKYQILKKLADDFSGQKYDLNNPNDRQQMKIRLLRMFHPRAKDILYRIADAYYNKFQRPLRVTSLTRSIEYQISLNSTNANSFPVRGSASLPPHTSGCAFDLARKHMSVEEQNFLMNEVLAKMEQNNEIDALIEYNVNACFHNFIYADGKPPSFAKK